MKRVFDLVAAAITGMLCAPIVLACAIAVRWRDGSPVLFRQTRIGRDGRPFTIFKFRTMRAQAGPLITSRGDARVTPVGRWLRRTKLDELPQLWNVLAGTMSVVGPRPEVPHYVERHAALYRRIADLRPGVTDWASLFLRDEESLLAAHADDPTYYDEVLLPLKIALARLYRRHASLALDLRLTAATAWAILAGGDAARHLAGARVGDAVARRLAAAPR